MPSRIESSNITAGMAKWYNKATEGVKSRPKEGKPIIWQNPAPKGSKA